MKKMVLLLLMLPLLVNAQSDYKKISGYKFLSIIEAPKGFELSPGQFSKDMKRYYMPVMDENGVGFIYKYEVDGKGKAKLISKHEIEVPEGKEFAGQTSLTEDEKTVIFTVTSENSWENNEICIAELETKNQSYKKSRLLGEINDETQADAYSYLSADGLRIYWVRNNQIYFSSRKERNHAFREAKILDIEASKVGSFWLSADELKLYYVSNSIIYFTKRKDLQSAFEAPKEYSKAFIEVGFVAAYNEINGKIAALFISTDSEVEVEFIGIYKKK